MLVGLVPVLVRFHDRTTGNRADNELFFLFLLALYFFFFSFVNSITEVLCFSPSHTKPKYHHHPLLENDYPFFGTKNIEFKGLVSSFFLGSLNDE